MIFLSIIYSTNFFVDSNNSQKCCLKFLYRKFLLFNYNIMMIVGNSFVPLNLSLKLFFQLNTWKNYLFLRHYCHSLIKHLSTFQSTYFSFQMVYTLTNLVKFAFFFYLNIRDFLIRDVFPGFRVDSRRVIRSVLDTTSI